MNFIFISLGLIVLLFTFVDFFYTTLSCSGSGKLTEILNNRLYIIFKPISNSLMKNWVGLIHIILTIFQWVILIILGSYLIYLSNADMIVDTTSKIPASELDRLYFTLYVYSTLGLGDLIPGNGFSKIFTGFMSIGGLAMLTTGITYSLSVTKAALEKKTLAGMISNLGDNPISLYKYFTETDDDSILFVHLNELVYHLQRHSDNHLSFPIIHFFLSPQRKKSVAVQLISLYESLQVLKNVSASKKVIMTIKRMENGMNQYLEVANIKESKSYKNDELDQFRETWNLITSHGKSFQNHGFETKFSMLLFSQGWSWSDVYNLN